MVKIRQPNISAWQTKYSQVFDDVIEEPDNKPYDLATINHSGERQHPYTFDSPLDYKVGVQPLYVEKEVIKEIYLTPVSPMTAAAKMYRWMKGEVKDGKKIYSTSDGRIVSR